MSRGQAPAALATPQITFRPYLDVEGVYDEGLAGVAVTPDGKLKNVSGFGVQLRWGISGAHSWRHTSVGLDYTGGLRHYNVSAYDTVDQAMMLGVSHQFSPHTLLTLRNSAGTYSRNFNLPGLSQTIPFDPISTYIPTVDFFDNRTYYASTQADFTFQKSARLSFNVGGDGFLNFRRSKALSGAKGTAARGDIQYRLSRRATLGATYNFYRYVFTRTTGGSDIHTASLGYSVRLTRDVEFSGYGGVMRVESLFVQSVPLDPVIATLLGMSATQQRVYSIGYRPNAAGRLSKRFRTGMLFASAGHTVTPGNGLFLTSYSTTALGGYTYTGLRRWSFNINAGFNRSIGTGQLSGNYSAVTGNFNVSRSVGRSAHLVAGINARQYQSADYAGYNRLVFDAHLGIGFTPGDLPFRLW